MMTSQSKTDLHFITTAVAILSALALFFGGCSDDETNTGGGGTGGSSGTGGGGTGGSGDCDTSQCPGETTTCEFPTCAFEICDMGFAQAGLACTEDGGTLCDGEGNCVECINDGQCPLEEDCIDNQCGGSSNNNNGDPCTGASECDSGFCVDDVCCGTLCDDECEACSAAKSGGDDGVCTPAQVGTDPDQECGLGERCNGNGACMGCAHIWSDGFGEGTQDQFSEGVATDGSDNVIVTGRMRGTIDFGCGALSSAGGKHDVLVAKFDSTGTCLWSKAFGEGTQDQFGQDVAVDGSGNILVTGRFRGNNIDFGCGNLSSAGGKHDVFVAKLDASGACLWSKGFGEGTQDQFGEAVATDITGNTLVAGRFRGNNVDFGCGNLSSAGGKHDIFVAKLAVNGDCVWSQGFGEGTQDQFAEGIAVDSGSNVLLTGRLRGNNIDFGCGNLSSVGGKRDILVVKFDGSGTCLWHKGMGDGVQDQRGQSVAIDSSDNVIVTGRFRGSLDFGGGALASVGDKSDVFLAKYNATGVHQWSQGFGNGAQDQFGEDVAVDSSDNLVITGIFKGLVDFGGGSLPTTGAKRDIFVATLDGSGAHQCSQGFGNGTQDLFGTSVAADSGDNAIFTGRFRDPVDFGGGLLTTLGGKRDIFVAKFSP
jgi:hypothetical protein